MARTRALKNNRSVCLAGIRPQESLGSQDRKVVKALLLILIFAFSTLAAELSEPLPVELPMYFNVKGTVRMYDGPIFPWSIVSVLDGQQNVIYVLQVDGDGNFVFPALAGETYTVRGVQAGYAYAPAEITLANVNSDISGLLLYAGPDSWFPPQCIIPKDGSTNVLNAPCFVDITATATDDTGVSVTSAPQRIYFHPLLNPSPTRFLNGYVKVDGNYFSGSALVTANGQSFTTQPGGYFELYSVPLGSTLTASAAGYVFPSVTVDSSEYFILDGTALASPSPTPTATPTPSPSPTPTATPTPSPTPTPTPKCIKWNPNGKCIKWA